MSASDADFVATPIEATVDRNGLERHLLSKSAKDMGSAAVLASRLFVLFTWGLILIDRFLLSAASN